MTYVRNVCAISEEEVETTGMYWFDCLANLNKGFYGVSYIIHVQEVDTHFT